MKDETVRRLNELGDRGSWIKFRIETIAAVRAERHRIAVEEADREDPE